MMNNSKKSIVKGFSKISNHYETLDKTSSLINWMRKRVRHHLLAIIPKESNILEINCGSGIDAVFLAKKGFKVHATDIATGMIAHVKLKIASENLDKNLTCQVVSFDELHTLNNTYHHLFSNFGGLNCSSKLALKKVFKSFCKLLTPNGKITLVIMPKICIWEFLSFFKGNKNAFRRLKKGGVLANIENEKVHTYYHSVKEIKQLLSEDFTNFNVENICFLGPTGNKIHFPKKHPFLFRLLSSLDVFSSKIPFLQGYGDYYIISAQRKSN